MTIATKLAKLNTLRIAAGKLPLASWKNSEAELDTRIAQLAPAPAVAIPSDPQPDMTAVAAAIADAEKSGKVTKLPTGMTKAKAEKEATKVAAKQPKAKKVTRKAPVNAKASPSEFSAFIAKLGIDPKVARARLRRAGLSAPYSVADAKKVLTK